MNTKFLLTAVAALALSACATAPKPLQGQFSLVSPRDSVATQQVGTPVRWGGRIIETKPGQGETWSGPGSIHDLQWCARRIGRALVAGEYPHLAPAEPAAGAADPDGVRRQRERGGAPAWHQPHHPLPGAA